MVLSSIASPSRSARFVPMRRANLEELPMPDGSECPKVERQQDRVIVHCPGPIATLSRRA